jgi:DNA-binding MarR family transcriptional regulator
MKVVELEKETSTLTSKEKLLLITASLKDGQGIPIAEVAEEIGIAINNVKAHAKKLGCYTVRYNSGKALAFVIKP